MSEAQCAALVVVLLQCNENLRSEHIVTRMSESSEYWLMLLLLLLLNTFIQNRKGDKNASLGGYITPVRKSSLKYKYITDTYKATEKYINHQSLDKQ